MTPNSRRKALLVGSLPFEDETEAMQLAMDKLGPTLLALPDGEIGERTETHPKGDRAAWVQTISDRCEADTETWSVIRAAERNEDGFSADYGRGAQLSPKVKRAELAEHLDLGWSTFARQSYPLFKQQAARSGRDDLRFQVGLPTALGMTFGMMSPLNALRYSKPFTKRLAFEANEILDFTDGDVQFQLEVPGELALAYRLPSFAVGLSTRTILDLVGRIRPEAPFGIHVCFGDLNNKALINAPTLDKLVNFTTSIVAKWPTTHELNYIHIPLAEAEDPPPIDTDWYAPLAHLDLPEGVRFVAGFVHDRRTPEEHLEILGILDGLRPDGVDVASSCGLGRRDRDTALGLLDVTMELTQN
ncbi:MAG: hypothetical protein ACR2PK_04500 [Acidimicrobiales bacterium]